MHQTRHALTTTQVMKSGVAGVEKILPGFLISLVIFLLPMKISLQSFFSSGFPGKTSHYVRTIGFYHLSLLLLLLLFLSFILGIPSCMGGIVFLFCSSGVCRDVRVYPVIYPSSYRQEGTQEFPHLDIRK